MISFVGIKDTPSVNGGNLNAVFKTLRCEKGLEHEYWVNFDQINNAVMEEWTFMEGQRIFGGRSNTWRQWL